MKLYKLVMSIMIGILLLSAVLYLIPGKSLSAQPKVPKSEVELIGPGSSSEISVSTFDPVNHRAFADYFQRPELAPLSRYAVVVTNESAQAVNAVTLLWTITDPGGATQTLIDRHEGYYLKLTSVIPERSEAVFWPMGYLQSSILVAHGKPMLRLPSGATLDGYNRAAKVSAIVDTVIMTDGHVIGLDRSNTLAYLVAREKAADIIIQTANNAKQNKEDPSAIFANLAKSRGSSNDFVQLWIARLARKMRTDDGQFLEDLQHQPRTPIFVRGQ